MTHVVLHLARWPVACAVGLLAALAGLSLRAADSRYVELSRKFGKTRDQAKVVAASYLGGPGTEWLVSGGFQPDGTVVVAGTALGPALEIGSGPVKVLGTDEPPPGAPQRKQKREKGK